MLGVSGLEEATGPSLRDFLGTAEAEHRLSAEDLRRRPNSSVLAWGDEDGLARGRTAA